MGFGPDDYTGKTFGKYEVLCRLAVGGMAEIFLGFCRAGPFSFQPLVLKRLLSDQREDPTAMRLLIDEARNTATLNHPNVARVFDLEVTQDDVLLVIQFINGANLEELIKASIEKKELLPVGFIVSVIRDAAQGLNHAHQHKDGSGQPRPIVHRDVTPRNVMVGFDGKTRVLDFGIARKLGSESRTMAGMVRGTTAYMSPEQAIGNPPDHRSDLFALGTICHELLVGQRLFSRENPAKEMAAVYEAPIPIPSAANRRVPRNLDPVLMKLLERPVEKRYQSATDFVREVGLAAGSTAWPPERCAELVQTLFADRRKSIDGLLDRIAVAAGMADEKTGAGVIADLADEDEPRTMIERPGLAGRAKDEPNTQPPGKKSGFETNTQPGLKPRELATDPGMRAAPTDPSRDAPDGDGDVPTHFFKPRFDGGPDQTMDGVEGAEGESTTTGVDETVPRARRNRSALLVVGAILAMSIGAFGGALLYRSIQASRQPAPSPPAEEGVPGVGRVSITTNRPAEVQLGGQILGKTPVVDVYLPSGNTVLRLREPNGPWREVMLSVKRDQMNKFEVKLDDLPLVP